MADPSKLYVQTLGQELPPQDTDDPALFAEKVGQLAQMIEEADAVAVGIGSGMSTSCGYDFYHSATLFEEHLGAFGRAHGFSTLFDGLYHVFSSTEEQWAFNLAVAGLMEDLPVGRPYERLAALLAGREHFVVTTNVDGQFAVQAWLQQTIAGVPNTAVLLVLAVLALAAVLWKLARIRHAERDDSPDPSGETTVAAGRRKD